MPFATQSIEFLELEKNPGEHLTQRQKRACISSNRFFPKGYFFLLNNSNLPYRLSAKRIVNLIVIIESCQKGYVCLSDGLSTDIKNNTQLYVS